jgi:hypothetical protein
MCVHEERRMGERAGTVHTDDAEVPEHWHDNYITRDELKGYLARQTIAAIFASLVVLGVITVWAVDTKSVVDYDHIRLEELRREGSLPVQQLKSDLATLALQMAQLTEHLDEVNATLKAVRP